MTDTTLYAGLVGQKLHGTIRTNGLVNGDAMNWPNRTAVNVISGVILLVVFVAVLLGIVAGNLTIALTAIVAGVFCLLVLGLVCGGRADAGSPNTHYPTFSFDMRNIWDTHNTHRHRVE